MKLNLGCGFRKLDGHVNVDRFATCAPDVVFNLEETPWPWPTGSATTVVFHHSLEHMGGDPEVFLGMMKELYRVCAADAAIRIVVPHPRHDSFMMDPTHVRAITPNMFTLFSKAANREWRAVGRPNTPFGLYLDVDFEVTSASQVVEEHYFKLLQSGALSQEDFDRAVKERNNVVAEYVIDLKAVK